MPAWAIRLIETPEEMTLIEELQRQVWSGSETEVVPAHLLITTIHNGGVILGAFVENQLVGFVFGFPGLDMVPDGPQPKHCSHLLAVLPGWRDSGLGFALKRAQWQVVRHQGLDHITWTYDPLLSRNAYLNIAKLGAVCNTYRRSEYGEMRDGLNAGLPSDRFQVDWWLNTRRVERRLSRRKRPHLGLDHFTKAGIQPLYSSTLAAGSWLKPPEHYLQPEGSLLLAEIPVDFMALKAADMPLAQSWRLISREVFESCFHDGYLVTDFIYDRSGDGSRSFYVLAHGHSTLDEIE